MSNVPTERVRLLLRGGEAAELLGVSRSLAYRWMAQGIIPVVRIPGTRSIRVPREALIRWIEELHAPGKNEGNAGDHGSKS
jgi:excisionase family DNA binding protein